MSAVVEQGPAGPARVHVDDAAGAPPRALLPIVLVAYPMILIDNSIVFTGVPSIPDDLT